MKVKLEKAKLDKFIESFQAPSKRAYIKDLSGLTAEGLKSIREIVPKDKEIIVGVSPFIPYTAFDNNFGPYNYSGGYPGGVLGHYHTIDELIVALEVMESIEAQIDDSWSNKEKTVFCGDFLHLILNIN